MLYKVLVVEDELIIRRGLRYLMDWESCGFEIVAETRNGKEALEKIEELHPNIVITDIVMPVMDGIELIKELSRRYPEIQIVVLSAYSDFEYVKSTFQFGAVDYILKPTLSPSGLLSAMKAAAERIAGLHPAGRASSLESRVEQLLSGYGTEGALTVVSESLTNPFFVIFGTNMAYALGPDADFARLRTALDEAAGKYLAGARSLSLIYDSNVLLLLVNYDGHSGIERELEQVAEHVAADVPGVFFVCGKPFVGAENIADAYSNDLYPNLRGRFYYENEPFLLTSQIGCESTETEYKLNGSTETEFKLSGSTETEIKLSGSTETEYKLSGSTNAEYKLSGSTETEYKLSGFTEALNTGDVTRALRILKDRVTEILNSRSLGEKRVKTLAQNAVYQVITAFEKAGADQDALDDMKRDLLSRLSAPSLATEFRSVFLQICDMLDESVIARSLGGGSAMSRMLSYINANFSSPLTLNELANRFGFNYHYLSSYFGSNNPEGFSRYLTNLRIKKAEELLADPEIQVSDISARVGYTDHSYFARVFKRLKGITPSDYRAGLGLTQK